MKPPSAPIRGFLAACFLAGCFLAPWAWIFRAALFAGGSFVFRDAAHYYYPLFAWTTHEWSVGRIPLWNPHENGGAPAAADPTASVFYPGKLLFALPGEYATRYKAYILAHVLLAGGTAFFAARRWRASPPAAAACALSYALGGSVIFQYCNVVYLVGAAWLPLAFWTADGLLRRRRWPWACGLGAVLAMMILGGDPQTAYHGGLVALLGLWLSRRSPALPSPAPRWRPAQRRRLALLAGAALVAGLLAAVQILPAQRWTQQSDRAAYDAPRSLYELLAWRRSEKPANGNHRGDTTTANAIAGLLGPPAAGTHHEHLYEFSVGPWRWAELLWPNFSGRLFPISRRWIAVLPAEGRTWTPSLYLGLAPLVAAIAVWRLRGGPWRARWLSWTALGSLLAALGWYGLGWLWLEARLAILGREPETAAIGAPTGGLYWLLVNVLPGYVYFRYPAKWLTVASLAMSLLAARGWDATFSGRSRRARRWTVSIAAASLAGIVAWSAAHPFWNAWMQAVPPDDLFGPLDADGAARDLLGALLHTFILCLVLRWLMRGGAVRGRSPQIVRDPRDSGGVFSRSGNRLERPLAKTYSPPRRVAATWGAVCVTAVDLALAHGWLAPTAPREVWQKPSAAAAVIAQDAAVEPETTGFRVFRAAPGGWLPAAWRTEWSDQRQIDGLRWDRDTLFPKHHLPTGLSLVESQGSMAAADFLALMHVARTYGWRRPDGVREPAQAVLDLLGTRYVLAPHDAAFPGERIAAPLGAGDLANVAVWRNSPALPRAWIVHDVVRLAPLDDPSPAALRERTRAVLLTNGRWRDFGRQAVVETNEEEPPEISLAPPASSKSGCRVVVDSPPRVEIEVHLETPGLLVLNERYDAEWQAHYRDAASASLRPLPLLRTNRVLRGVWLPAGAGRVAFVYRPATVFWGGALSGVAWLGWLLAMLLWAFRRNGRRRSHSSLHKRLGKTRLGRRLCRYRR